MIDRRRFIVGSAGFAATALAASRLSAPGPVPNAGGFELTLRPSRVFKRSDDQNRLKREYWVFILVLHSVAATKPAFDGLVLHQLAKGEAKRVVRYPASAIAALDLVANIDSSPGQASHLVAAFQIADAAAQALAVDALRCELALRSENGSVRTLGLDVSLETYRQRTDLVFPFRGHGMISQGGAWNDGHRNRSGMFAIDAIGLTDTYAPMIGTGDAPEAMAGWGRPVIAPAAGEVVVARGDRPDQPLTGVSDPKYFVPEYPQGGDPGNHCVIDHGNGEFSMVAHFQSGSLRVKVGDRVVQGQELGLLGNSGDSSAPHVHHQLQSGPQWPSADALPHVYGNGPGAQHDRGTMFEA